MLSEENYAKSVGMSWDQIFGYTCLLCCIQITMTLKYVGINQVLIHCTKQDQF